MSSTSILVAPNSYNIIVPINFIFVCGADAWLVHSIAKETASSHDDSKTNFKFLLSLDPRTTAQSMKERFIKGQQSKNNSHNNIMMMNHSNLINKKDLVSFFVNEEMNLQIFPKIEELIFRSMLFTTDDDESDNDEEMMKLLLLDDGSKVDRPQNFPPVLDFIDVSAKQRQNQRFHSNNNNNNNDIIATTFLQLINSEITIIVDAPIFTRTREDREDLFFALNESLKNKISIHHHHHHGQNEKNNNVDGSLASPTICIDWEMGLRRHCLEILLSHHRQDQNNINETPQQENLFHTWAYGWELGQRVKNEILTNTYNSQLHIPRQHPSFYKKLLELSKAVYDSVSHHEMFFTSIDFLKSCEVRIPKIIYDDHQKSSIALFLPLDAIDLLGQIQLQEIVRSWFRELAASEKSRTKNSLLGHASTPPQRFVIWTPPLFSKDMILFPHRNNNSMNQQKYFQNRQLDWNRGEGDDAEFIDEEKNDETDLLNNYSSTKFPYSVWPSVLSKALGNISENAAQCPMIGLWYKKTVDDENNKNNEHQRIVHSNQRELRSMLGFLQSSLNLDLTQCYMFCPSKPNEVRFYENIFGIKNLLLDHHRSDKEEEEKLLNDYLASSANNSNEHYVKWLKYFSSSSSPPIPCTVPTDCVDDQNFNENQLRVFIPPDAEELIMYEGDELFGCGNEQNTNNHNMMMMASNNDRIKNDHQPETFFSNTVSPSSSASKQQQKSSSKRQTQPFSLVRAVSQKIAKLSGIATSSSIQLPNSNDVPGTMTKALQEQLDEKINQVRIEKGLPHEPAFTNSYVLFCHLTRERIKRSNGSESLSMKSLSEKWNALSNEQRHEYITMIRADDERYRQECAEYVARRKKEINNPLVFVDTPLEEIQKVREVFYQEHGIQIVSNSAKRGKKQNTKSDNTDGGGIEELLRSGSRRQRDERDQDFDEKNDDEADDGEKLNLDDDLVHPDQFEIRPVRNSAPPKKKQPQNSASSKSYDTQKDIDEIFAKHLGHFD